MNTRSVVCRLFCPCAISFLAIGGCAATPSGGNSISEDTPNADAAWQRLADGNARFVSAQTQHRELIHRREELVAGQMPWAIVLTCADSRVGPEIVFDQSLGDLFVVRNAGNVADPIAIGSIEYAVEHFHCHVIVVMGHSSCGAVAAAGSKERMPTANLQAVVDRIQPALASMQPGEDPVAANVHQSAQDLYNNSPIVGTHVQSQDLKIIEAVYQLNTGRVEPIARTGH